MVVMQNVASLFDRFPFRMPWAGWVLFVTTTGALVFAYIMQYVFDVQPCILCLWQRVPLGITAMLALTAVVWRPYNQRTQMLFIFCALSFLIELSLAVFHTGVELHWWLGTSGCVLSPLHGTSPDDLRQQLLHTVVARCDQISWTFLGLSMANWNIPFSLGFASYSTLVSFMLSPYSSRKKIS